MAGLASGADAAYIYEEPFKIRDLEVCLHVQEEWKWFCWKEGLIAVWLTDECRASGREDEDHGEEGTDSEVDWTQFWYSYGKLHPTLISFVLLLLQKWEMQRQLHHWLYL